MKYITSYPITFDNVGNVNRPKRAVHARSEHGVQGQRPGGGVKRGQRSPPLSKTRSYCNGRSYELKVL